MRVPVFERRPRSGCPWPPQSHIHIAFLEGQVDRFLTFPLSLSTFRLQLSDLRPLRPCLGARPTRGLMATRGAAPRTAATSSAAGAAWLIPSAATRPRVAMVLHVRGPSKRPRTGARCTRGWRMTRRGRKWTWTTSPARWQRSPSIRRSRSRLARPQPPRDLGRMSAAVL